MAKRIWPVFGESVLSRHCIMPFFFFPLNIMLPDYQLTTEHSYLTSSNWDQDIRIMRSDFFFFPPPPRRPQSPVTRAQCDSFSPSQLRSSSLLILDGSGVFEGLPQFLLTETQLRGSTCSQRVQLPICLGWPRLGLWEDVLQKSQGSMHTREPPNTHICLLTALGLILDKWQKSLTHKHST